MPPVVNHNDPSMRRMVQVAGWVAVVVGALVALFLLREEQPQWSRLALNLCVAGVGATTLVALHLGRQVLAAGQPLHHGFAGGHRRFVCIFPVG